MESTSPRRLFCTGEAGRLVGIGPDSARASLKACGITPFAITSREALWDGDGIARWKQARQARGLTVRA